MKLVLTFIFILLSILTFAQKNDVQLLFRYGISERNLTKKAPNNFDKFDYQKVQSLSDIGGIVLYSHNIWKKGKVYVSGGLEFSSSSHYQQILENGGAHLDNVNLRENRRAIRLGLSKNIHLYNSKVILEFGLDFIKRKYASTARTYSSEYYSNNEDWIEFKYDLKTYHGSFYKNDLNIPESSYKNINSEIYLGSKFKTSDQTFLSLKLFYSRNNLFFYDYTYSIQYFENGSTTPTSTYTYLGLQEDFKNVIKDQYWYFSLGFGYRF